MKKIIVSFALILATLTMIPISTVNASNFVDDSTNQHFIEFIDKFYNDKSNFYFLDNNDRDVTEQFYIDNLENYFKGDYRAIESYVNLNISEACESEVEFENINSRSPFVNGTVSNTYFKTVEAKRNGILAGQKEQIQYRVSGTYVWDRATSKITSAGATRFQMLYTSFGKIWSWNTSNTSASSQISSDKYSVTFRYSFNLDAVLGLSIGNLPAGVKYDFGYHTGTATGYPSDQ